MLSPFATEAIFSATYVDNYIDSVENLPDDVQRQLSRIREIDVQYRGLLRDVDHFYDLWQSLQHVSDSSTRKYRAASRMHQSLIQAQELGDEKMQIVNQLQELIDHKTRQLNTDQRNLDIKENLQLQQQHRVLDQVQQIQDDYGISSPLKLARTQSPLRGDQMAAAANGTNLAGISGGERHNINFTGGKDHNSNSFSGFAGGSISSGGGGSTPNSERSGNASNGAPSAGGNNNPNALGTEIQQRAGSKRSRRRNDTAGSLSIANNGSNMEIGGNESNSANETGIPNERSMASKSAGMGIAQKKNTGQLQSGVVTTACGSSGGTGSAGTSSASTSKKKKRKARGAQSSASQANTREDTPPPDPIDPDEPTYCVCNQISFGEMILCDNDLCPIEWFHFSCVSLVLKPKGKWYCPNCRGDRPNVMKPKAQFLKELERYNKEREEKT